MIEQLYGKHAAALYAQAADFNKTARFYYMKAQDAYYLANAQASYDDGAAQGGSGTTSTGGSRSLDHGIMSAMGFVRAITMVHWEL
eukprot:CAMPEP_0181290878 /NCGR_PEP_ID=MMETSP1101-20121128/1658_1 /TAXON_ID=46948 /ORGANISM="Rhodomonas abbreviata, Strain Caron Lab Isolate" /LENGTH=85 /DNA_ID=CAMNT_0023395211 /DNA_START=49 /DNA_END=307 /DNA_ORIENTATION=+